MYKRLSFPEFSGCVDLLAAMAKVVISSKVATARSFGFIRRTRCTWRKVAIKWTRTALDQVRCTAWESALHSRELFLLRTHLVGKDPNRNSVSESRDKHTWEAPPAACLLTHFAANRWTFGVRRCLLWWYGGCRGMARPMPADNQQLPPLLSNVEI